jgi:hypothetical protein
MSSTCAFCGTTGKLTAEHVYGAWLTRIDLELDPVAHVSGPLNRMGREIGVNRPFRHTVRDVCGPCNNGWMSRLEDVAKRVLTPFILGESGRIARADQGAVAAWLHKTALVAMLVSSEEERAAGYGLSPTEYRALYDRRVALEPLPATQVWIGRYGGEGRLGSTWVTPLVLTIDGLPEPDPPHGYAMTLVLGELLLQGVRFTTRGLQLDVATREGFAQMWPVVDEVAWPPGTPVADSAFLPLAGGKDLPVAQPHVALGPWKSATELAESQFVGSLVELPTICGKHVVFYPGVLVYEARHARFYGFIRSCECGTAYLIETEADGAHCKAAGTPAAISERYEALSGEEYVIEDESGSFWCKRLAPNAWTKMEP